MTTVLLEGRMGKLIGKSFSFNTRTLREVFAAIEANTEKLQKYFSSNKRRHFAIFVNDKKVDLDAGLNISVKNKTVRVIPILKGNLVFTSKAIATAIVSAAIGSAVVAGVSSAAVLMAVKITTFVVGTILSAALSFGISLLMAKLFKPDDPNIVKTTSFVFGEAENTARQGLPVPLGYGRMMVGSNTVSVGNYSVDKRLAEDLISSFSPESSDQIDNTLGGSMVVAVGREGGAG